MASSCHVGPPGDNPPTPLSLKPNFEDAAKRWQAYLAGDIIGRPLIQVTCPRSGVPQPTFVRGYHRKVFADIPEVIDAALAEAEATYWGGEAMPSFNPSLGPDEVAVFCGGSFAWSPDSDDTNWSVPYIDDWQTDLPFRLRDDHPLWLRVLALCREAASRLRGKMAMSPLDLHTNMDLLAAARGPQQLCLDLIECPALIDRAMVSARAIFSPLWQAATEAGKMSELGYSHGAYSMDGAATLQCDFSAMISPAMFNRWVAPALEEEAAIVEHAFYHWDGKDALIHADTLVGIEGLHTLAYEPGAGGGSHSDFLELYQRLQAKGQAIEFCGPADEVKAAHPLLRPELTCYYTWVSNEQEAESLLSWFEAHT